MMHNYILKKILVNTHLYIGLILGLVITLICVSGSAIVYKPELEKLSVKKLAFVEPSDRIVPLQYLLDNVRKKYPQLTISNMVLYGGKDCAYSFRTTSTDEKGRIQVYVNQYTGEVLGIDRYRHKIFQWLYDLHVKLLLKKNGVVWVAVFGFLLIFLIVSGLFLYPSKKIFNFRQGEKPGVRCYRLHIVIGLFTALFLFLIAFTGCYFGFKKEVHTVFESVSSGKALQPAPKVEEYSGQWISLDAIMDIACKEFTEGRPMMIFFPKDNKSVFSVRMYHRGDFERTGSNHIYIHPITGKVVKLNLWKEKPTPEKLTRSMYFIHFGTFWGHYSRILWIFIGLVVPFLYFTGFYAWWSKLKRRQNTPYSAPRKRKSLASS